MRIYRAQERSRFVAKRFWLAKGGYWQHLFHQHDFPSNICKSVADNSKEQTLLMDRDRGKP